LVNRDSKRPLTILVDDLAYGGASHKVELGAAGTKAANTNLTIERGKSHGWHDLRVRVQDAPRFEQRFAGHVETGRESFSDPAMGRVVA
jgi:phospholipase C